MKNGGEDAVDELRALSKRHAEIKQKHESILGECKKVEAEIEAAEDDFLANPSVAAVRPLILLQSQGQSATNLLIQVQKRVTGYYGDPAGQEFLSECQQRGGKDFLRNVLVKSAGFRLTRWQETFDNELKRARETLTKEGFDKKEILESPRVRDAARAVEKFERLISVIDSAKDEVLWQSATEILND